jgi:hypothetical protein
MDSLFYDLHYCVRCDCWHDLEQHPSQEVLDVIAEVVRADQRTMVRVVPSDPGVTAFEWPSSDGWRVH